MARRKSARSQLYRFARDLGNLNAISNGPSGVAKRYVRRGVYRKTNTWTQLILRRTKLW